MAERRSGTSFCWRLLALGLVSALGRRVRNAVRLVLRRERHLRDNTAARQVLLHAIGLRRIDHVTHRPAPGEGACSQALASLMARALAAEIGVPYAHTPLAQLAHAEGDPEAFAERWEDLLGIGEGCKPVSDASGLALDINVLFHSDLYNPRSRALLHRATERLLPDLRTRFHAGASPLGGPLMVAIHVRRGDVTPSRNAHMWIPPEQVRATAQRLSACLGGAGIAHELVIVSQGAEADLPELAGLGCRFVLDEDPLASFRSLAEADVLVVAKSSYSYFAALLSRGVVLEGDCGYPRLPHWLHCRQGAFDEAALLAALSGA